MTIFKGMFIVNAAHCILNYLQNKNGSICHVVSTLRPCLVILISSSVCGEVIFLTVVKNNLLFHQFARSPLTLAALVLPLIWASYRNHRRLPEVHCTARCRFRGMYLCTALATCSKLQMMDRHLTLVASERISYVKLSFSRSAQIGEHAIGLY